MKQNVSRLPPKIAGNFFLKNEVFLEMKININGIISSPQNKEICDTTYIEECVSAQENKCTTEYVEECTTATIQECR